MKTQMITLAALLMGSVAIAQNGNGNGNGNGGNNGNGTNAFPSNGNVGIGNSNPAEKLRVSGDVLIDSTMIVLQDAMFESSARVDENLEVDGQIFVPNMEQLTQPEEVNWTVIQDDGQMKIITRDFMLGVLGSSECYFATMGGGNQIVTPSWKSSVSSNGQMGYLTTGSECLASVGIGTSSPINKLDVVGSGYFSESIGIGTQPNPAVNVNVLADNEVGYCVNHQFNGNYGYAYKAIVNNATTKGFGIYNETFSKDVFTVYGSGKIEVSNQTGKIFQLDSDGLIRSREIKVDLQNWPDYVFKKDYEMLSIPELDEFISENGHLPNVPNAEAVESGGLALGEMNRVLMEKVEELTLYIIAQDKRMQELNASIELNKTEIQTIKVLSEK